MRANIANAADAAPCAAPRRALTPQPLAQQDERAVLEFLALRPLHTVNLAGLIRTNGIDSPHNRGTFYACRDDEGQLEGVALIGHATLVEAHTERALAAFAGVAQGCDDTHMIMAEQEQVASFWQAYAPAGQEFRLACRELMFTLQSPVGVREHVADLRLATLDELDLVVPVHAEMAFAESGVNPLATDPVGFRRRCARRIEQGRTWVLVEEGRLVFKADAQAETPELIYLEGIYVAPEARGRGYGLRCLSQLARTLLERVPTLCLLVNEQNRDAHALYRRVGFKFECLYDTIFLSARTN